MKRRTRPFMSGDMTSTRSLAERVIRDAARNLWITAIVLIAFSFVFLLAEKLGRQDRPVDGRSLEGLSMRDAIVMGLAQCLALIPGVSRSGGRW